MSKKSILLVCFAATIAVISIFIAAIVHCNDTETQEPLSYSSSSVVSKAPIVKISIPYDTSDEPEWICYRGYQILIANTSDPSVINQNNKFVHDLYDTEKE